MSSRSWRGFSCPHVSTPGLLPGHLLSFLLLASFPVGKALLFLPLPYAMKGSTAFPLRLIPSALLSLPTFASPTKLFPKIRDDSCLPLLSAYVYNVAKQKFSCLCSDQ